MQRFDGQILDSATDVVGLLECAYLKALNLQSLGDDALRAQRAEDDASAALVARKDFKHERA